MTVNPGDSGSWSTIQVSNVPPDTSRYQLEHFFTDIGPVKKCFVVTREFDLYSHSFFTISCCSQGRQKEHDRVCDLHHARGLQGCHGDGEPRAGRLETYIQNGPG